MPPRKEGTARTDSLSDQEPDRAELCERFYEIYFLPTGATECVYLGGVLLRAVCVAKAIGLETVSEDGEQNGGSRDYRYSEAVDTRVCEDLGVWGV